MAGENEGAATAAHGGAAAFRPSTNDEIEKRVPFGDVQQLIDAASGPGARTPSVVGLAGIWSELRMLRVALVERNQLLAEANAQGRRSEQRAIIGGDIRVALEAYRDNPNPDHATAFVQKFLDALDVERGTS